jgi:prephenate dehydrogenase
MKIGIVGLGLMGGSLALSLRKLSFVSKIYGLDHNTDHQKEALRLKLVDNIIDFDELCTLDVIVLAIPVNGVITSLQALEGKITETTTIIDLGSTKEAIIQAVPPSIRKNFVAAHPMTGTEQSGPGAALAGLYNDQVVVLCDLEESGTLQQETAVRIFSGIHMRLSYMHAHEHDRHAAFISHMPHVISYSIANSVLSQEDRYNILAMAAGGFRSMSRLAKSSPDMWEDIFKQNKTNLLDAIETFQNELEHFKKEIKNDEWQEVRKKMLMGNKLDQIFS